MSINLQEQQNADGSLNYLKYKYRGSEVKINFGYNADGKLMKINVPSFLNLSHKEIFDIINRFYIERINTIQLINQIDTILNIVDIQKIGLIAHANISQNLVKNGDFETGDLSGWIDNTAGIYNSVISTPPSHIYEGKYSLQIKPLGSGLVQSIPPTVGNHLHFAVASQWDAAIVGDYYITLNYEDGSNEVLTLTGFGAWFIQTAIGTKNVRVTSFELSHAVAAHTLFLDAVFAADSLEDSFGDLGVLPKAKGKTTIIAHNVANNATVTVHTVTAGKTFYLTGCNLNTAIFAAAVTSTGLLVAGGVNLIKLVTQTSALIDRDHCNQSLSPCVPMPFAAGTVFQVFSGDANTNAYASIIGWEE